MNKKLLGCQFLLTHPYINNNLNKSPFRIIYAIAFMHNRAYKDEKTMKQYGKITFPFISCSLISLIHRELNEIP